MIKKQYVKSRKVIKISFALSKVEIPEDIQVESVSLVGDFNDWAPTATPMISNSKGVYRATLDLEPSREYQFRYLVNGQHWCNDWHTDAYVPNSFGEDNCVVHTPTGLK